jgi:Fe2+ or Zn2+ uptake regulation protein
MSGREEPIRVSDEERAEQAVLALLLEVHPAQLSIDEVVRELSDRPDDFAARDRIRNVVRDLAAAGLVHRHGAFVFASRAAVRFDELQV